jgi:hypothetical protein
MLPSLPDKPVGDLANVVAAVVVGGGEVHGSVDVDRRDGRGWGRGVDVGKVETGIENVVAAFNLRKMRGNNLSGYPQHTAVRAGESHLRINRNIKTTDA